MKNKIKEKRGRLSLELVVVLILILLGGGLLGAAVIKIGYSGLAEEQACLRSVQVRGLGLVKFLSGWGINPFPLKCKTEEIEIVDKNPEKIKEQLAATLYDSWYKLGEGQYDFLSEEVYSSPAAEYYPFKFAVCAIPSIIFLDESLEDKNIKIENFDTYLLKEDVPYKDYNYYEFFSHEYDKDEKTKIYEVYTKDSFDLGEYALVYYYFLDGDDYIVFREAVRYFSFGYKSSLEKEFYDVYFAGDYKDVFDTFGGDPSKAEIFFALFLEPDEKWEGPKSIERLYPPLKSFPFKSTTAMLLVPLDSPLLSKGCYALQSLP